MRIVADKSKARVIEVLGDIQTDLGATSFLRAVELYRDLHGMWPTKLYITIDDLRFAQELVKDSNWEKMVVIVDDPPHFHGWFVGVSYDHGVGSEGA
jgi:hypothetical protein